jgi:hypothetical protein
MPPIIMPPDIDFNQLISNICEIYRFNSNHNIPNIQENPNGNGYIINPALKMAFSNFARSAAMQINIIDIFINLVERMEGNIAVILNDFAQGNIEDYNNFLENFEERIGQEFFTLSESLLYEDGDNFIGEDLLNTLCDVIEDIDNVFNPHGHYNSFFPETDNLIEPDIYDLPEPFQMFLGPLNLGNLQSLGSIFLTNFSQVVIDEILNHPNEVVNSSDMEVNSSDMEVDSSDEEEPSHPHPNPQHPAQGGGFGNIYGGGYNHY